MSWEDVSHVIGSKTRKAVLAKKGLIESLTPKARVGKIFVANDKGKKTLGRLKEMEH